MNLKFIKRFKEYSHINESVDSNFVLGYMTIYYEKGVSRYEHDTIKEALFSIRHGIPAVDSGSDPYSIVFIGLFKINRFMDYYGNLKQSEYKDGIYNGPILNTFQQGRDDMEKFPTDLEGLLEDMKIDSDVLEITPLEINESFGSDYKVDLLESMVDVFNRSLLQGTLYLEYLDDEEKEYVLSGIGKGGIERDTVDSLIRISKFGII